MPLKMTIVTFVSIHTRLQVYYLKTGSRAREGDQRDEGEHLRTFEEGAGKGLIIKERFFPGNAPGMLDFVMGSSACWLRVLAELTRIELVDEESTPILCQRLAFEEVQVIKKTPPLHEKQMPMLRM